MLFVCNAIPQERAIPALFYAWEHYDVVTELQSRIFALTKEVCKNIFGHVTL